jgi:hypothetical protein
MGTKSRCLLESQCSRKCKSLPLQLLAQQLTHVVETETKALWCLELESDLRETDMRRVTLFGCKKSKVLASRNTFTSFILVTE